MHIFFNDVSERIEAQNYSLVMRTGELKFAVMRPKLHLIGVCDC